MGWSRSYIAIFLLLILGLNYVADASASHGTNSPTQGQSIYSAETPSGDSRGATTSDCGDMCHLGRCHFGHCFLEVGSGYPGVEGNFDKTGRGWDIFRVAAGPFLEGPKRPPRFS